MSIVYTLGRVLFGGFFLYNGINHFTHGDALKQYAQYKQVPEPDLAVKLSGAVLIAAGASLVLGLKPRLGALGVLGFLGLASPLFHDFWNQQDATQKQNETIHFTKNMALLAAALTFAGAKKA